ncbi:MAG: hypothetical protein HYU99_10950, partial [Deltaproteobacteria bacterium]|nr:hypothetical protein [Deltaproteobacteria bacterium]
MSIPSITDLVRDFVPSFPTAGPTAGIGGSPVPVDSYTPEPTPGDDLGGVTGGGSAFRYPVTTLAHPINPALLTDDGWTSTGTSSGVRIEKKTVDGMTAYRATRGGLTIPPEKIARAIMQVDRYKDRGIKYVDSVQVLSRANGRIVYGQHLNFGAIADRLSVLEIGVTKWTGA